MRYFLYSVVLLFIAIFSSVLLPANIAKVLNDFNGNYADIAMIIVTIAAISLAALEYTNKYRGEISIEKVVSKVDPNRFNIVIKNTGNRSLFKIRAYRKEDIKKTLVTLDYLLPESTEILTEIGPEERVDYRVKYKRNRLLRNHTYRKRIGENFKSHKEIKDPDKVSIFGALLDQHFSDQKTMKGSLLDLRKILQEIDNLHVHSEVTIYLFNNSSGSKLSIQVGESFSSYREFVLSSQPSEVIAKFNLILGDSQQVECSSDRQVARWVTSKKYISARLLNLTYLDIFRLNRERKLMRNDALSTKMSIGYVTNVIHSLGERIEYSIAKNAYSFHSSSNKYTSAKGISFNETQEKDFIVQPRALKVDEEGFVLYDSVDDFNDSTLPNQKRITVFSITDSTLLSISDGEIVAFKIPMEMRSNFVEIVAHNLSVENSKRVRNLLKYIKDSHSSNISSTVSATKEGFGDNTITKDLPVYNDDELHKLVDNNNKELSKSLDMSRSQMPINSKKKDSHIDE